MCEASCQMLSDVANQLVLYCTTVPLLNGVQYCTVLAMLVGITRLLVVNASYVADQRKVRLSHRQAVYTSGSLARAFRCMVKVRVGGWEDSITRPVG